MASAIDAQSTPGWINAYRDTATRLIKAATADDFAWQRLAELTDTYGNRLSGSENLSRAVGWAAETMKKDGLEPIAFADKDGWPAMGTFDILNMRTNGYDFHVSLMAGEESWEDPKVRQVFSTWADLLPYHQAGSLGRTWQEAAQSLVQKKTGMYLLGTFASQQFTGADLEDLDFFAFPEVVSEHGTDSIDAPIDGLMMASKPKNEAGAKALLEYIASADAENIYLKTDPGDVGANKQVDQSGYNAVQKKSAEIIGSTANIAQFLDRDTRPDFASTVMIPALQDFIKKPSDINGLTSSIEKQKKSIFV